ncbi:MAG: immunoglobulin domain-containing protein, partial [Verrucomicrobiae bacterium]|nr:immunoglobulin domain-containing protein [Verrucomicrobiae bacterium]
MVLLRFQLLQADAPRWVRVGLAIAAANPVWAADQSIGATAVLVGAGVPVLVDPSFHGYADQRVAAIAVQPDGQILVGGRFSQLAPTQYTGVSGVPRQAIGRFSPDGVPDPGFNPGVGAQVECLLLEPDGRIMAGGRPSHLVRLTSDGQLDPTSVAMPTGYAYALLSGPGTARYAGGNLRRVDATTTEGLVRLLPEGSPAPEFQPLPAATVRSLCPLPDGSLVAGGDFGFFPSNGRKHIARVAVDGTLDEAFKPDLFELVSVVLCQPDGKLVVSGRVKTGSLSLAHLVRLNPDGSPEPGFDLMPSGTGLSSDVFSLALQADGKIVVGGSFTELGGQRRKNLARLNADGSIDPDFDPGAEGGNYPGVYALALQEDGRILVGGDFLSLGGEARYYIGRLTNTDPATHELTYDGSTVSWFRGGTSPEVWRVTFEVSADGENWMLLDPPARIEGGWELSGVVLPEGGMLRARGFVSGGQYNGSNWFVEDLLGAPVWVSQPESRSNEFGTTATLSVRVGGTGPFSYQWQRNGVSLVEGGRISGTQSPTLRLEDVHAVQAGDYTVTVRNDFGSVTSEPAMLTVLDPLIRVQPVSQQSGVGRSVTFAVGAIGSEPLGYQWWKDGAPIPGATAVLLKLDDLQAGDAGEYSVVVSNGLQSATSDSATLDVAEAPWIATQPVTQIVDVGQTAALSVEAYGAPPLGYAWHRDGVPLEDGGNVAGAHAATLELAVATDTDHG